MDTLIYRDEIGIIYVYMCMLYIYIYTCLSRDYIGVVQEI